MSCVGGTPDPRDSAVWVEQVDVNDDDLDDEHKEVFDDYDDDLLVHDVSDPQDPVAPADPGGVTRHDGVEHLPPPVGQTWLVPDTHLPVTRVRTFYGQTSINLLLCRLPFSFFSPPSLPITHSLPLLTRDTGGRVRKTGPRGLDRAIDPGKVDSDPRHSTTKP